MKQTALFSQEQIAQRVQELGAQITADYAGCELTFLVVLKSAAIFAADLARAVDLPVRFEYISASSYGSNTRSSGSVAIDMAQLNAIEPSIRYRNVIIIEDIIDSGATVCALVPVVEGMLPKSLEIAAIFNKASGRGSGKSKAETVTIPTAKYIGFEAPNEFLVGYGMDYDQLYRNLPNVLSLSKVSQ